MQFNKQLVSIVASFMEYREFIALSLTCRRISKNCAPVSYIYEQECQRVFSGELELFREVMGVMDDCEEQTDFKCVKERVPEMWRSLLIQGVSLKNQWAHSELYEAECSPFTSGELLQLRDFFFLTMRDPPVPLPVLKKERKTNMLIGSSILQDVLLEYMFSQQDKLDGVAKPESKICAHAKHTNLVSKLLDQSEELQEEVENNNEHRNVFVARWYLPREMVNSKELEGAEEDSSSEMDFDEDEKTEAKVAAKSFALQLLYLIEDTARFHARLSFEIIASKNNVREFTEEYIARWNAFAAALTRIDEVFDGLNDVINNLFEAFYPDYPNFPKFSLMRLMMTIWRVEVFEKVEETLSQTVVDILSRFQQNLIAHGLFLKVSQQKKPALKKASSYEELIKNLLPNKQANPHLSKQGSVEEMPRLDKDQRNLLARVSHCFLDFSVNELNVHYVPSTVFNLEEQPINRLKIQILKKATDFYNRIAGDFPLIVYSELVSSYQKSTMSLFPGFIENQMTELKFERAMSSITDSIDHTYLQNFQFKLQTNPQEYNKAIQMIQYTNLSENMFFKHLEEMNEADLNGKTAKELFAYIKKEDEELITEYNKLDSQRTLYRAETKTKDDAMTEKNEKHGFPLVLSEEEVILYNTGKSITLEALEELHQKYLELSQQEEENEEEAEEEEMNDEEEVEEEQDEEDQEDSE